MLLKQNIHIQELHAGTANAFILRIAGYIIAYLFMLFVAKAWGSGVTGIFVLAILIIDGLALISTLGLENSVLILISKYHSSGNEDLVNEIFIKSFLLTLIISVFFSFVLYLSAEIISTNIFNKPLLIVPLKILALCLPPLSLIKVISQFLRAVGKIKGYVFFNNVIVYLLALTAILIMHIVSESVFVIYFSFAASCYVSLILSFFIAQFELQSIVDFKIKKLISIRHLLDISIPLSLSGIITFMKSWLGVLVAGIFLSKEFVGTYGITVKMISIFSIIIFSVQSIMMPKISALYAGEDKLPLNDLLYNSSRITAMMGIPALILAVILAKPVLNLLGSSFNTGFIPFLILCIGQLFELIFLPANSILQMVGKQKKYLSVLILSITVQAALLFSLINPLGIIGAAIAASAATIFQTLILVHYLKKKMNINVNYIPRFISYLLQVQF